MKAKDIKPGVVYAYQRSKYSSPQPVVFLTSVAPEHLYRTTSRYRSADSPAFQKANSQAKPKLGTGYSDATVGYPAVIPYGGAGREILTEVTLDEFKAATGDVDHLRDIEFRLVTSLGHIIGPYEEVVAAQAEKRAAEEAAWQAKRDQETASHDRAVDLITALAAHGVKAGWGDTAGRTVLTLSLDEMDKLLAMLPTNTEET